MSAGYLRCQQHSSLACNLAPHRSNLQTLFKLRTSNSNTSAASAQTAKGVRSSPRVYSTSSSHHVVHVHTPLPLQQVALGPNGEYVIAYNNKFEHELEEMTTVARAKIQGPSEGKESKKPSLLWSKNSPYDLQEALAGFRSRANRSETAPITPSEVTVCLSKVKWVRVFWVIRRVDGLDVSWVASKEAGKYFSSLHLTEGSKPTIINDLNQLNDLLYIAPSGCVAEIGCELAWWGGLPESLNDTLAKYHEAYEGTNWLSVGTGGEWFVQP